MMRSGLTPRALAPAMLRGVLYHLRQASVLLTSWQEGPQDRTPDSLRLAREAAVSLKEAGALADELEGGMTPRLAPGIRDVCGRIPERVIPAYLAAVAFSTLPAGDEAWEKAISWTLADIHFVAEDLEAELREVMAAADVEEDQVGEGGTP